MSSHYIRANHTADAERLTPISADSESLRHFRGIALSILTGLLCGLLIIQVVTAPYALGWALLAGYGVMSSMILLTLAD